MPLVNNNRPMVDLPSWEQLSNAPANSAAGSAFCDDNERYAYILFSATSFWRFDTWADAWQQLASPPGGTLAAGSCIRYVKQIGSQVGSGVTGSVFALLASGTAVTMYRYMPALNAWSAALSVTNVPATWGTDGRLVCPEPTLNAYQGGYHSSVALNTITTTAAAASGATTLSVSALPLALPANAVLNFGTVAAPLWAVVNAAAAAGATALTVAPLSAAIGSGLSAYWYADMFLFGNNATQAYRYNFAGNAWSTTSANSGTPALAAVPAAPGAGTVACWLPGSGASDALNTLVVLRGAASSSLFSYNLATNTWTSISYQPATETFTTGSSSAVRSDANGKNAKLIVKKDTTGRIYQLDMAALTMTPLATQNIIGEGAALVGDKMFAVRSPDGIDYMHMLLSTSPYMLRSGLFF